jgi:hypothetical protein
MAGYVTREQIRDALDDYFDWCKFGDTIPIVNGRISVEVLIDKGKVDMVVGDRMRKKEIKVG